MDTHDFERLTDKQKECLRLAADGYTNKEIARELGLSPTAVVERLRGARQVLGVEKSREAALLLRAHETRAINIKYVDTSEQLARTPYPLALDPGDTAAVGSAEPLQLRDSALSPVADEVMPWVSLRSWPRPWRAREMRSNDLTTSERLRASAGITITVALSAAITLIAAVQLMTFLIEISRHGG